MKKFFLAAGAALFITVGLFAQDNQQSTHRYHHGFDIDKKVERMAEKLDLNASQKAELREYFETIEKEHEGWYMDYPHKREMIEKKREWIEKKRQWNREKRKWYRQKREWNRSKREAHEKKMEKILGIKKYKIYKKMEKERIKAIKKQQKIYKKRAKEMQKRNRIY